MIINYFMTEEEDTSGKPAQALGKHMTQIGISGIYHNLFP